MSDCGANEERRERRRDSCLPVGDNAEQDADVDEVQMLKVLIETTHSCPPYGTSLYVATPIMMPIKIAASSGHGLSSPEGVGR